MYPQKQKSNADTEDSQRTQSKENITWAGNLEKLLAFQMRDEYQEDGSQAEKLLVERGGLGFRCS